MKKILFFLMSIGTIIGCSDDGISSDNYIPALYVTITSEAEEDSLRSKVDWGFDGDAIITPMDNGIYMISVAPGITNLPEAAFSDCRCLKSVDFVDNVFTSIGERAFHSCYALIEVSISNSITSIGRSAFERCKALTSINIPNGVSSIEDKTFWRCTSLTNITFSDNSITHIGNYAFNSCAFSNIHIPYGVTTIGDYAFSRCEKLSSVLIPGSVTSIGNKAFEFCKALTSIEIPYSVNYIGNNVFNTSNVRTMYFYPTTPPTLGGPTTLGAVDTIYVPTNSVEIYKGYGGNWSTYKYDIKGF